MPARPSVARTKNTSAPSLTHLTTVPPQPPSASSGWGVKIKARSGVSNGSIDLSSLFAWGVRSPKYVRDAAVSGTVKGMRPCLRDANLLLT